MTKFKVKNRKLEEKKKKALESMETDQPFDREASPDSSSEGNEENEDFLGGHLGRVDSPGGSDGEEVRDCSRRSRYKAIARRRRQELEMVSDFVDLGYWKRETVCCGIIFKGLNNEIMVDPSYMKPCRFRQAASCKLQVLSGAKPSEPLATKAYSDSSSDSGYDDSSNQSALSDSATAILKKDSVVSNRMVCIAEMHRMASRVN